jgi:hypothetical protein
MRLHFASIALATAVLAGRGQAQPLLIGGLVGGSSATQNVPGQGTQYERRQGLTAGLTATLEVGSWFALQAGALYAEKGARLDRSYEMRNDYLDVPLLARFASPVGFRGIHPFLVAGMAPSVELKCSGYTTPPHIQTAGNPPGTVPLDCQSQRRHHSDRGRVFGGGVLLNRGLEQLVLEFRRTRGQDISGYDCCQLRNDVEAIVLGVSRRVR